MLLNLLNLLSSLRPQDSLSTDSNVSYEWHLRANEQLLIKASAPGASIWCSTYDGLAVEVGVGGSPLSAVGRTDSLVGVDFGAHTGALRLTAREDAAFAVHIRFLPYEAGRAARVLFAQGAAAMDGGTGAAPPAPQAAAGNWAALAAAAALAVCLGLGIIWAVRRDNHGNYEEIEISESEDFGGYIPAVGGGQRLPPYVACRIENESIAHISNRV
jgi:hypothetical protein